MKTFWRIWIRNGKKSDLWKGHKRFPLLAEIVNISIFDVEVAREIKSGIQMRVDIETISVRDIKCSLKTA